MITDKMIQAIISDMVVIVDTREKKNAHVLKYFNDNGIGYKVEKLDTADYTVIFPNYPQLNLDGKFLVERKNSLDEISQNFTKHRERFIAEFERSKTALQIHLVIETATWKKLLKGSYRSQFPPKSFMASLLTWCIRYRCPVWFVQPEETGELVYNLFRYEVLEFLKNNRDIL